MIRAVKIILIGLITTSALAPCTQAGPQIPILEQPQRSDVQLAASAYFPREAIQSWNGERFRIYQISWFDEFDAAKAMMQNWISTHPDEVAALQATIRRNKPLAAALRARNVQLNNVAAVQQSFSGGLTFYLR